MKRYLKFPLIFIIVSLISFASNAQEVFDDFEGNGTISTWYGDDCEFDTDYDNPVAQGINTSSKVMKYNDTGGQYANVGFDTENNFDLSQNYTFSLKIYIPSDSLTGNQPNQVSLKLQNRFLDEPWTTQTEIIHSVSLDQWQTVSFDFNNDSYINFDDNSLPPVERTDFNRVLIKVNGENNTDLAVAYIDDFQYDGTIEDDQDDYSLIWSDEFVVDGAIDSEKWFHQTKLPSGGSWFNNEIQHYTDRTDNAVVEDGILKIIAKKETYTDQGYTKNYTSARLNSKFAFTYGKVEVKAKLPSGVGTWPAIWMLGKNINEDGAYWETQGFGTTNWPDCGEIDIMEHWGSDQNFVQSATHTPSSYGATENHGGQTIPTASTEFHVYTLEWTLDKLIFSVDGNTHYIYEPQVQDSDTWPYDADQYLLLNIAIQPNIEDSFTESAMEIDYVRVYQRNDLGVSNLQQDKGLQVYPNPVNDQLKLIFDDIPESETALLKIYNMSGQLVKAEDITTESNQITLKGLGPLPKGVYSGTVSIHNNLYGFKMVK